MIKYTKEKLILLYKDLRQRIGVQPSERQWLKDIKTPSLGPVKSRFGKWSGFIKAMGLEPISQKGNGHKDKKGYIWLYNPKHPNAYKGGRIQKHRLKMSEKLGRPLREHEKVH